MPDLSCPLAPTGSEFISLGHGAGGKAMQDLIQQMIAPLYQKDFAPDHDGAVFKLAGKLAFTTDSYVIKPLFFPGGDIGQLSIYGTVNDLAMCGASPLYLACAFILEEGLSMAVLQRVCASMLKAAQETGVAIVTGDTKVVARGEADGLYINTTGIGRIPEGIEIHPRQVQAGDILIISGDIGRHGIAVMTAREGLALNDELCSDCAALATSVQKLLAKGLRPKCLRDLTRGGLAAALQEISASTKLGIEVEEIQIPVHAHVRGVCEILGLDPLYIASEGRFLAIVAPHEADETLHLLHSINTDATIIGSVNLSREVEVINSYGSRRILPALQGELLPRIC